jgi:hypothetical protein
MTRLVAFASVLLAACSTSTDLDPTEVADGMDEPFLDAEGRSAVSGISEDMPEARGILLFVNSTPTNTLAEAIEWPEGSLEAILAHRLGADATSGTADDGRLGSLAALDAVPFIGPRTFSRLLAYVQTKGVAGVAGLDETRAYTLGWPADSSGAAPQLWVPEMTKLRLHVDVVPGGGVQLAFVGDIGTWFVFQGTMSATGHIDAPIAQNLIQSLSGARIEIDPIYGDRFCARLTGTVNLGQGAVPFTFPLSVRGAGVAADASVCP